MEFDPRVVVIDDTEDDLNGCSVHEFISSLRSSFRPPDFDRMEEYLMLREKNRKREKEDLEAKTKKISDALSAELGKKRIENELLEGRHAEEVSERLLLQGELNECKRQCERLKENVTRLSEDQRVMCDREKRGEERYGRLLEELKRNEECIAQLNCRNTELECEKRSGEAENEMWKKRFGELESRILALEEDTEMLKRAEPNFYERMKGDFRVRTAGFPELRAEQEAGTIIKIKKEMDLESTSGNLETMPIDQIVRNSVKKYHASPGAGSSCHTPPKGIRSLQGGGGGTPAFVGSINISDSDDEMPKVMRSNSTDRDSKEVMSGKEELPQKMKQVMLLNQRGTQAKLESKQESLGCTDAEDTPKRKEASSLTRNPVFLKRFKGGTNAEDTCDIFNSDDSSSDSESEGPDDFTFDLIMSKLQSNHRG